MRKHYVQYLFPGFVFPETSVQPVKDRKAKVKRLDGAYAYRFFSREETAGINETLKGENKDFSGYRFFEGEILALDEVKKRYPKEEILIRNMETNGYKKIVHCKDGNWVPLGKKDRVLKEISQMSIEIKRKMGYKI